MTGLSNGHLRPCTRATNCVCSEGENVDESYVDPLIFSDDPSRVWVGVKDIIREMGGSIESEYENYVHATFRTRIFRFVDDLEARLDSENKCIHLRSASRVGYSDMGMNRKRVEELRLRMTDKKLYQDRPNK